MAEPDAFALHTPRLLLRPLVEADAGALLDIHADGQAMRYSNSAPWTGISQALELIAYSGQGLSTGRDLCLGLARREGTGPVISPVIGTCTLYDISRGSRRAELGFILGRPHWGQGCMHEALGALLGHAFGAMDLNRVEADTDPRNVAATRTLERLGFVREGLLRERWITDGEKSDSALYGLLRRDWAGQGA